MSEGRASLVSGMPVTTNVHLVKPLGAGGMGAVWLADHTGLNTRVVVKFMLGGLDTNAGAVKRFKREAEAAAQVRSPHVVQMLDHGVTEDGVPFIVMEHLEGRDLGAVLTERGSLPASEVVTIVQQIAKALTKVHAAGLLHRDIKPDNIFLCDGEDDLFVKLLDFGIAKSQGEQQRDVTLDGETKTGQVVGTPFYMSPEQVTAQKVIDSRSDLWSLGVVTFEALTGKRPFDGPSFGALAVKIATGTPPVPSEVDPKLPRSFDAWFAKACAREPTDRFGSARELADELRKAFANAGISLPPSGGMSDSSGTRRISETDRVPSPSFELASTAVDPSTPNPARDGPLARSEGGALVVEEKNDAKPGSGRAVALIASAGAIGVVLAAIFVLRPSSKPASPAPKNATTHPSAHELAVVPPHVSASASASARASASASAAPPEASAAPSARASAQVAQVAHAPAAKPPPAKPVVSASAAPPPKPEASRPPAVKPSPNSDPDLY